MEIKGSVVSNVSYVRPYVKGKFIFVDEEKFYIKGVTYGTFKPQENGDQFPEYAVVEKDFMMMASRGINSVRTYTVPPAYLLHLAMKYNLKVMVGIPWEQHITFLDDEERKQDIIERVKNNVRLCAQHPSILCYTIGNEIPAPVVRWYGRKKVEGFLKQLYTAVKSVDGQGLVTYVNYPTTEYLDLGFLDFYSFNVYLESPEKLNKYLSKLHNLCGNLPLVLAEIGLDTARNGESRQATTLEWQTKMIFGKGCAGMFVFSWTDEWWRGGHDILDWDFGVVNRDRRPKAALPVLQSVLAGVPFNNKINAPAISVVVCSYNGSATIRDCLESLIRVDYPNYEVIVVNDGSTDNLEQIVKEYPVRLITTANMGLSNARNTGMMHSRGEIIAYIDDDAYADKDWLNYLSYAFTHSTHAAIGGPNIVPPEDGIISKCVAASPGGPTHVLITDEIAEHIPGCNMAILKKALTKIGGFDPVFRAAGDDVDICWRLQEAGYTIGFHHSAVVWHHRRNSIKAYWKQQKGYGKAEALLEKKWPQKYNALGHYAWGGSIYGNSNTLPLQLKRERIFYGSCGSAPFQSVYQPADSLLAALPLMPEWLMLSGALLLMSLAGVVWAPLSFTWILFAFSVSVMLAQAFISAVRHHKTIEYTVRWKMIFITAFLHFIQPVARLNGRVRNGLTPWRKRGATADRKNIAKPLSPGSLTVWSETWRSYEDWIANMEKNLIELKTRVKRGQDFDNWDLQSRNDFLVSVRSTLLVEEHGGGKQFLKLKHTMNIPSVIICLLVMSFIAAVAFVAAHQYILSIVVFTFFAAGMWRLLKGVANSGETVRLAFKQLEQLTGPEKEPQIIPEPVKKRVSKLNADLNTITVN